jgi:hypothetical protein
MLHVDGEPDAVARDAQVEEAVDRVVRELVQRFVGKDVDGPSSKAHRSSS